MSRAGPRVDITGVGSGWVNGAEKWLKWNLSERKVHDVFYEVMRSEKILDRLWWKNKLQQILRNVIFSPGEEKTFSDAKIRNKIISEEVACFAYMAEQHKPNILQSIELFSLNTKPSAAFTLLLQNFYWMQASKMMWVYNNTKKL